MARIPTATPSSYRVPLWALLLPVLLALVLALVASQRPDGRLHVWVLDVGQGDAALVRTPGGHTALVDGGPGITPLAGGVGQRLPFWQHDIDLVVLTHPQQDHMMGLIELVERYDVKRVVQTAFEPQGNVQQAWDAALRREHIPVHHARRGDLITFEGEPDVALRVLHPSGDGESENPNEDSIVLRLEYGSTRILLAGDAEAGAETDMLREALPYLGSDVLKVAHHGSGTSTTPTWLDVVNPSAAVISVGADNRLGHPSPTVLARLEAVGATVYRTDLDGTVEIVAEQDRFWVQPER
jgi:competence protein ComEC